MKAAKTLIAWSGADAALPHEAPSGSIAIGPLMQEGGRDWAQGYPCTGGAAYVYRRKLRGLAQQHEVMLDWHALVYSYGLDPYIVHRAFLLIDEYQTAIKARGRGPAKDEPGHDPTVPYGRTVEIKPPELKIFRAGGATHFWPAPKLAHASVQAVARCCITPIAAANTPASSSNG